MGHKNNCSNPAIGNDFRNQRDVMHQLVQDIKNAMVNALKTVDTNHETHQQIIQAQTQHLQRLTAEQEAFKVAMRTL